MKDNALRFFLKDVLKNMPSDWLSLTTHRLDIYNEAEAKTAFLNKFEELYASNDSQSIALSNLPTAFDYIRLGHPISCILEWFIAKINQVNPKQVISFSSKTIPLLAILRKNLLDNKKTQILYTEELPTNLDIELLKQVYGYQFELKKIDENEAIPSFDGYTIFIAQEDSLTQVALSSSVDFHISLYNNIGSVLIVNETEKKSGDVNAFISAIQHVRRRETIAMTPANSLLLLKKIVGNTNDVIPGELRNNVKSTVLNAISTVTGTDTKPILASSGLSMQYAIMMGLIDDALEKYEGKKIKFIVPPNCYGGTNDQARRVAACISNVEIVDLPVDGNNDMVRSIDSVLKDIAFEDAVPFIIAEIPTNPRVEVPDLAKLEAALAKPRETKDGNKAVEAIFILDQTFCPNVHFLGKGEILSSVHSISYVSGSKFPSGGRCTAGYAVANKKTAYLLEKIEAHINLCDNDATPQQYEQLAEQLPSMNERITKAYQNTREFVNFIEKTLPEAKINFVSEELALQGFTPSVFSLDLPTKGATHAEREAYKRTLNMKLINMMITEIPDESKFCVSYGQLKGCYWTIPATSTQGTTKESDKDYIVRVSLSPEMNVARHKAVFASFVAKYI